MSAEQVGTGQRRGSGEACAWVVRGEPGGGELEGGTSFVDFNLDNDVVTLGWGDWAVDAPVAAFKDMEMLDRCTQQWSAINWEPDWKESFKREAPWCIWRFCNEIYIGDIVVLPPKGERWIAIGEVTGPAERDKSQVPGARLYRPVKWLAKRKSRVVVPGDLLSSINSQGTIFRPGADDHSRRIQFCQALQDLV